jgi:hypothetical protein
MIILLEHGLDKRAHLPCQAFLAAQSDAFQQERMLKNLREKEMMDHLQESEETTRRALKQGFVDAVSRRFP